MGKRCTVAVLTIALLGLTAAPAVAGTGPPDGPRAGYTITLPELAPLAVEGGPTQVLTGVHDRAGYAIEVPPDWNGELVMWRTGSAATAPS